MQHDTELLSAALIGYQAQHAAIVQKIAELQSRLNGAKPKHQTHHRISAEGRERIAAAQRKRWAEKKRKQ